MDAYTFPDWQGHRGGGKDGGKSDEGKSHVELNVEVGKEKSCGR